MLFDLCISFHRRKKKKPRGVCLHSVNYSISNTDYNNREKNDLKNFLSYSENCTCSSEFRKN